MFVKMLIGIPNRGDCRSSVRFKVRVYARGTRDDGRLNLSPRQASQCASVLNVFVS